MDKLWNVKYKLPGTRTLKGTYYITKKSCADGGNPIKKEWPVTLSNFFSKSGKGMPHLLFLGCKNPLWMYTYDVYNIGTSRFVYVCN